MDSGAVPDFRPETAALRASGWHVATTANGAQTPGYALADLQSQDEARSLARHLQFRGEVPAAGMVLRVDSVWAALELDEIVYELKNFVSQLACDYDGFLLSLVQVFSRLPQYVLPDRSDMTPNTHCLRYLSGHIAAVGQRRGTRAANQVPVATEHIEAADLLLVPRGRITAAGMRYGITTAIDYLRDRSGPPTDASDLARANAAELARAQLWQWVQHETGVLDEGRIVTPALFTSLVEETLAERQSDQGIDAAAQRLSDVVLDPVFVLRAFDHADSF